MTAVISECGRYRYKLTRTWNTFLRPAGFIMLNPSTADATLDDPTIRRCIKFAKRWDCGGIEVANLFGYRATDPSELLGDYDPIGPENDRYIREVAEQCHPVVLAWGAKGSLGGRYKAVLQQLESVGVKLFHLGLTKDGFPRHPLYLRADAALLPYVEAV
jgi:hypothetical protein